MCKALLLSVSLSCYLEYPDFCNPGLLLQMFFFEQDRHVGENKQLLYCQGESNVLDIQKCWG